MSKKIVTFGEIMMRLTPSGDHTRFLQASQFDIIFSGAEANVAVSLANYGDDAWFVTKVPSHEIGQAAVNALRRYGVHTDKIARGGNRLGIYYAETGASVRGGKVIYDRAGSAIATADPADFDFDAIFEDAIWFHWSGITPALSDKAAKLTLLACQAAKRHGVTVSCDLNYRKKLWTPDQAQIVMKPLMQYVDVCIGNEEDAAKMLGFVPDCDIESGNTDVEAYKAIFRQMEAEYHFKMIATTLRESHSASDNGWKALLYDGKQFYISRHYEIDPIVDRTGAGDSFSAGLIHGILHYDSLQKSLDFAIAASALKHTLPGDFNCVSEQEALTLAQGTGNGRIVR